MDISDCKECGGTGIVMRPVKDVKTTHMVKQWCRVQREFIDVEEISTSRIGGADICTTCQMKSEADFNARRLQYPFNFQVVGPARSLARLSSIRPKAHAEN